MVHRSWPGRQWRRVRYAPRTPSDSGRQRRRHRASGTRSADGASPVRCSSTGRSGSRRIRTTRRRDGPNHPEAWKRRRPSWSSAPSGSAAPAGPAGAPTPPEDVAHHQLVDAIESALGRRGPQAMGTKPARGPAPDRALPAMTPARPLDTIMRRSRLHPRLRAFQNRRELHPHDYFTDTVTRRGQGIRPANMTRLGALMRDGGSTASSPHGATSVCWSPARCPRCSTGRRPRGPTSTRCGPDSSPGPGTIRTCWASCADGW